MQVGDLVKLSAYGEARQHNSGCHGGWGFVIEVGESYAKYPIQCQWYRANGKEEGTMRFHRRELRKYKPDKK